MQWKVDLLGVDLMGGHLDLSAINMSDPLMEVNKILILCSATDSSVSVFKEINSKIV